MVIKVAWRKRVGGRRSKIWGWVEKTSGSVFSRG